MTDENAKRSALTDRMRDARNKGVVALQGYNTLRSKFPGEAVLAVEGDDDPIFYRTCTRTIKPTFEWVPLVCNGKDKVLALRVLLGRNMDADASRTFFAVDKDFDQLKGHEPGPNLYCTPGYSIENLLVSSEIFKELIVDEYKCEAGSDEVEYLQSMFEARLADFCEAMTLANKALHFCRVRGVRTRSVENRIKQYVTISLNSVTANYSESDLEKLIGVPSGTDIDSCKDTSEVFLALDPLNDWRGKFLLFFFVEMLSLLQEDRCSPKPTSFNGRRKVSFNPRSSIVRVLSSIIIPPPCLTQFINRIAA